MKVYLFPNDENEIAAVTVEPDTVLGALTYNPKHETEADAVKRLQRLLMGELPAGAAFVWCADPHAHPDLAAMLDRLAGEPDDDVEATLINLCDECEHAHVCVVALHANAIAATIRSCAAFASAPETDHDDQS